MHKKLTSQNLKRTLLAAAVVGAGIIGTGTFVANAYDAQDPTTIQTASPDDAAETATATGLVAQVDTDAPADTPADPADTPADAPQAGRERGHRGGGCDNEAVAAVLGLTVDELHAAREAGSSLADVAAAQGVDVNDVIQAIVDDKAEHLADEVASGEITQAEADQRLEDIQARATERVNHVPGE